jgi:hypothetical protein
VQVPVLQLAPLRPMKTQHLAQPLALLQEELLQEFQHILG